MHEPQDDSDERDRQPCAQDAGPIAAHIIERSFQLLIQSVLFDILRKIYFRHMDSHVQ